MRITYRGVIHEFPLQDSQLQLDTQHHTPCVYLPQEVAEAYGLSRERIRQIEDKALKVRCLTCGAAALLTASRVACASCCTLACCYAAAAYAACASCHGALACCGGVGCVPCRQAFLSCLALLLPLCPPN